MSFSSLFWFSGIQTHIFHLQIYNFSSYDLSLFPKDPDTSNPNDLRPVALKSTHIKHMVPATADPLQFACLSPKVFTLYTHDCVSTQENTVIIKYGDDTTILRLIKGGTSQGKDHSKQHSHNTLWRERPHPQHRQDKRNNNGLQKETCPSVTSYHHRDGGGKGRQPQILGTPGDIWPELDTTATMKRAQQRLYFIRKPRKAWAYRGLVESTLTTGLIVWYGNTTEAER